MAIGVFMQQLAKPAPCPRAVGLLLENLPVDPLRFLVTLELISEQKSVNDAQLDSIDGIANFLFELLCALKDDRCSDENLTQDIQT